MVNVTLDAYEKGRKTNSNNRETGLENKWKKKRRIKGLGRDEGSWVLEEEQEILGRTNGLLSLIRHGPHWKRLVPTILPLFCVCIRCRGKVSTAPLPSNDRGIFTEPSRYLATIRDTHTYTQTDGRVFLLGRSDWLRYRDIPTKFNEDRFRRSKVRNRFLGDYNFWYEK
jgi:hypothetical protein